MINGKEIYFNKEELEIWERAFGFVDEHITKTQCIHCKKKYDKERKVSFTCLFNGKFLWWHKNNCLLYKYSPKLRAKRKNFIYEYVNKILKRDGYISNKKFAQKFNSNSLKDVIYSLRNKEHKLETVVITNKDTLYMTPEFLSKMLPTIY